ncbi:ubiquitin-conjugating enzyme/RWD-like protein [Lineolata rhizophorae]|uniref:Ubiquitin-conjugating enzyme/RWD-like protein n=1 Tax=Lineolata rhizophorae TaxID=578093 RepID=A0A6A6PDM8_9PEZI|nr:ubiquitin-conjugating enzyme/RWD-like protein [Lineolata rhizophorae]
MSTRGQFNTKNPTIKRILKEANELANNASADYHAEPLEDNFFEWHFTLRGPPAPSPYAAGLYHGRIILPTTYPLRPPSFRFTTPTGRFEVNREICLSISGHHEETWQPAWGIRTALVALRAFMDSDPRGQVGGLDCPDPARRRFAADSPAFTCPACARSNADIMRDRERLAGQLHQRQRDAPPAPAPATAPEPVPADLRLAYREDLGAPGAPPDGADEGTTKSTSEGEGKGSAPPPPPASPQQPARPAAAAPSASRAPEAAPGTGADGGVPGWIDGAIYGLVGALVFMVLRWLARFA